MPSGKRMGSKDMAYEETDRNFLGWLRALWLIRPRRVVAKACSTSCELCEIRSQPIMKGMKHKPRPSFLLPRHLFPSQKRLVDGTTFAAVLSISKPGRVSPQDPRNEGKTRMAHCDHRDKDKTPLAYHVHRNRGKTPVAMEGGRQPLTRGANHPVGLWWTDRAHGSPRSPSATR